MTSNERRLRVGWVLRILERDWPSTPEGKMYLSVLRQAIVDAHRGPPERVAEARAYLQNPVIPCVDLCGVETDWVRRMMRQAGLAVEEASSGKSYEGGRLSSVPPPARARGAVSAAKSLVAKSLAKVSLRVDVPAEAGV